MAQAVTASVRMTAADYAKLGETTQPMELLDGEVIMTPAPIDEHQVLVFEFAKLVETVAGRGEVRVAPSDVYLDEFNVVQPDVFWVGGPESACKLGADGHWHGAPDLVIEILSPATALRDRREKFELYQTHGVREYWLIDPQAKTLEAWRLAKGKLNRFGICGPHDSFDSPTLSAKVDLARVFKA